MSAFVRYPLLGCLALSLIACGSSGSQTLLRAPELSTTATTSRFESVEYLLADSAAITAAREKFMSDPAGDTDATAPSESASSLNIRRSRIVNGADRYLSTGALVANGTTTTSHDATCSDGVDQTKANCVFPADSLRDGVTFHLGRTHARENNVGFVGFSADRQPVMDYRGVRMSQVRTTGTDTKTASPDDEENPYEYVGYDGMLQYSMFFVGVYRFFDDGMDDDRQLEHLRFENASLGRIYDADTNTTAIDNPTVDLTGTGVMSGVEAENSTLNSHLVQGDVDITYTANDSEIDIAITNIKRLVGSGTAWYADATRMANLAWNDVGVSDSKFTAPGGLSGSFYGTPDTNADEDVDNGIYEVGGVFYHTDGDYSIFGAFGAPLESDAQSQ